MWEEKLLQNGVKKKREDRGNKKHMLGGKEIQFPLVEGKREATKSEATRWKHSSGSCYLSSYTATFVSPFLFFF